LALAENCQEFWLSSYGYILYIYNCFNLLFTLVTTVLINQLNTRIYMNVYIALY